MAKIKKTQRRVIDKVLISLGIVAAIALAGVGAAAWWAYSFTASNVKSELSEQKIFFPEAGSPALAALPAADKAQVSKYAGQQLVNGDQAKVYANNFIGVHLDKVAGGKTYAEVSNLAKADPTNAKLQAQKTTLFQGETLRGLLLGDAYAFWTVGHIAQLVAIGAFIASGVMVLLVLLGLRHLVVS